MKKYLLDCHAPETLRLMNQTGVRQCVIPSPTTHTACWDTIPAPDGNIYLSLCSELTTGEYTKLAVYDPEKNEIRELAYLKDRLFYSDRWIRPSKIHTSLSWLEDGRLIMVTHTTDKAPQHPAWMPQAYYSNPWEGFPGSHMLIYDPATDRLENLGIPVPRETLYGGVYDPIGQRYYAIGFLKGHLYEINPRTKQVRDHGQVTERASYRMITGSDGNIYFTTRNGFLQRINVRQKRVENLHIQLPWDPAPGRLPPYISYGLNCPDGRMLLAGMNDSRLSVFDPASDTLTVLGNYLGAERFAPEEGAQNYMGCMAFDKDNILYYVICAVRKNSNEDYKLPSMLMRWDLFGGGQPEMLGLIGTPERVVTTTCTMLIDPQTDHMYIFGTNHADDGTDVTAVDLKAYRSNALQPGPTPADPLIFPGNTAYREYAADARMRSRFLGENAVPMALPVAAVIPLWQQFPDTRLQDSSVVAVRFEGNHIAAVCGSEHFCEISLSLDGRVLSRREIPAPEAPPLPQIDCCTMPCYPGRQYKRTVTHCVQLADGRKLAATQDGLLALLSGGQTYALGPAWINGPVQDMTVSADGTKVFGIAGDEEDFGMVFSYDDRQGLRWLGIVQTSDPYRGTYSSPRLTAIATDSSGKYLAIGAGGRMGHIYLYKL